MFYKYPTDLGWGEINSVYCSVSVAIPFCSNLELLFQACNGKFTYTLVYCPGQNNEKSANNYMDAFVKIMENCHLESGAQNLRQFLKIWWAHSGTSGWQNFKFAVSKPSEFIIFFWCIKLVLGQND